ncbi:MAG: hypothetical protein JO266_17750 [Acidobacteria bacterium]|nr:hypothetical protein [Acidobacteriota bacterium]
MFVRLNYIPRGSSAGAKARAFLGYIGERPGRDQEKAKRILFGHGGPLTPEQAEQLIREASVNTYFWRLIISPDPATEDKEKTLDLWDLTREAVLWLEKRLGTDGIPRDIPFIGAEHEHTDKRHIHAILLIKRQGREMLITPQILEEFRSVVAEKTRPMEITREQLTGKEELIGQAIQIEKEEQEQVQTQAQTFVGAQYIPDPITGSGAMVGLGISLTCPECGSSTLVRRQNSKIYECRECGYALRLGVTIRHGRRKEAGRARSL